MRIAFLLSFLELTGGHIAALEIAERLLARGHDVTLVYPSRSVASRRNDALRRIERRLAIDLPDQLFRINSSELAWRRFGGEILRVRDLSPRHVPRFDAIVATAWRTAEELARFPSGHGRRFYFLQHYETWGGPVDRVDATWRGPFVLIASSAWLRDLARDRFGRDAAVVPYGVDLDAFWPDPPRRDRGTPRVGLLYHAATWKGVADALVAVDRAERAAGPLELVIFGLEAPALGHDRKVEVHVAPPREKLRRIYSSLDVFLCGSWTETGPMTVPEAMACGVCVVSTEVGNVSLWTGGGEAAFLAPPRDPDALSQALVAALSNPAERLRRADLGAELIRAFTWDRSAADFAEILERQP